LSDIEDARLDTAGSLKRGFRVHVDTLEVSDVAGGISDSAVLFTMGSTVGVLIYVSGDTGSGFEELLALESKLVYSRRDMIIIRLAIS
jgi:hypothetical protein